MEKIIVPAVAFLGGFLLGMAVILYLAKEHRETIRVNFPRIVVGAIVTIVWTTVRLFALNNAELQVSWVLDLLMGIVVAFVFTTKNFDPTTIIDKMRK